MVQSDLVLDSAVRDWVLLPLTLSVALMMVLRQYMSKARLPCLTPQWLSSEQKLTFPRRVHVGSHAGHNAVPHAAVRTFARRSAAIDCTQRRLILSIRCELTKSALTRSTCLARHRRRAWS